MPDQLKVVVLDDDSIRKNQIREALPDYIDVICSGFTESAKNQIRPQQDNRKTDLVIMNAEDGAGSAPAFFSWLKNEQGLERVPVLLLCRDAFSDEALSFLETGDAEYYEGAFDPDHFFMKVMEVIDAAEMASEEIYEPSFREKDPDERLFGQSIKPLGETEDTVKRSIVLQHEEQLLQLDQALERGKKKQEKIREIMDLALKYKDEILAEEKEAAEQKKQALNNDGDPAGSLHRLDGSKVEQILSEEENRRTIVLVDHDQKNRKLCELFLKSDYDVVTLSTGMSAIDYFVRRKADLLLISYSMPILNGLKILDSIRWQPNGKKVPAIFLADEMSETVRKQCQKERVVGILTKPVQKAALRRSVDAVLSTLK